MNFEDLVTSIKAKRSEGTSSEDLVIWLKEALGSHFIAVKSAMEPVPEKPASAKKKGVKASLVAGKDGKFSLILPGADHEGRVMFVANIRSSPPSSLTYEARSVIMDLRTLAIIAAPPPPMVTDFNPRIVNKYLEQGKYRAYRIRDGTVITLYTYKGRLCMGSASSMDISDQIGRGGLSFGTMFLEAASTDPTFMELSGLGTGNDGTLRWKLPRGISATLGFRHHSIHPLSSDPMGVWFIRSEISHPALLSLPRNEEISPPSAVGDPRREEGYGIFLEATHGFTGDNAKYNRICLKSSLYLTIEQYIYRLVGFARRKSLLPEQFIVFSVAEATMRGESDSTILRIHEQNTELASETIKYVRSLESRVFDSMIQGGDVEDPLVAKIIEDIYTKERDLRSWVEGQKPVEKTKLLSIVRSRTLRVQAIDVAMLRSV